jgi:hypothetical protein
MRVIQTSSDTLGSLLDTLSSPNDCVWPYEKWPKMKFNNGLIGGSSGGHGPIRYTIINYLKSQSISFRFDRPTSFHGTHTFSIKEQNGNSTLLIHEIQMKVSLGGLIIWYGGIKYLHDALLEDCFDKVENQFSQIPKSRAYGFYVQVLRKLVQLASSFSKRRRL